jgi:hypothetical protein
MGIKKLQGQFLKSNDKKKICKTKFGNCQVHRSNGRISNKRGAE